MNLVEVGADAVAVVAQVVVVLLAVALSVAVVVTATLTVHTPILPVLSRQRLPLTATRLLQRPGLSSLQPLIPMLAPAGALLQRPKRLLFRDGVSTPILPGVRTRLPTAQ